MTREPMTDEQRFRIISAHWFGNDICWKCGGTGYWYEQIDGPDNLRTVPCNNPNCWPKTINIEQETL